MKKAMAVPTRLAAPQAAVRVASPAVAMTGAAAVAGLDLTLPTPSLTATMWR